MGRRALPYFPFLFASPSSALVSLFDSVVTYFTFILSILSWNIGYLAFIVISSALLLSSGFLRSYLFFFGVLH